MGCDGYTREIGGGMSTVRQRRANGSVYVYESHNVWDKEAKKVRAVRTYLGREDPETGELIPSSGRAGRRPAPSPASTTAAAPASAEAATPTTTPAPSPEAFARLEAEVASLRAERDALLSRLAGARASLAALAESI